MISFFFFCSKRKACYAVLYFSLEALLAFHHTGVDVIFLSSHITCQQGQMNSCYLHNGHLHYASSHSSSFYTTLKFSGLTTSKIHPYNHSGFRGASIPTVTRGKNAVLDPLPKHLVLDCKMKI